MEIPVVKIDLWKGRDDDQKRKLIQSVAKAVSDSLDVPVEHVNVILNDVPKNNWGIKGEQVSRMKEFAGI